MSNKIRIIILAIGLVTVICGLVQITHETTYAIQMCNDANCRPACSASSGCICPEQPTVQITCWSYCYEGCPDNK